jgi:hypothetical protein
MQGHARDGHVPGAADEVEQIPAGGLGLFEEKLGDGTGIAGQKFAVRRADEAMVGGLDDLLGGKALLGGGCRAAEAEQASDLGHLESGLGMEKEVAEQAPGKIVAAALFEEAPGRLQDSALGGGQVGFDNGAVVQPTRKGQ